MPNEPKNDLPKDEEWLEEIPEEVFDAQKQFLENLIFKPYLEEDYDHEL